MLTPVTKNLARDDTVKHVSLALAVVLFGLAPSLPAHALPTSDYNTSCTTTGITEGADGTANNLICNGSNKWQYPSYIIGSTGVGGLAITCSATTAGAVQWTGSILQYCSGSAWVTVQSSGTSSGIYLGTSASYTNPQRNGDATTGLYTANVGEVDVASGGNQVTQTTAGGFNVVTGSVGIGTTTPDSPLHIVAGTIGSSTYGVHLSATGTNAAAVETGLYANTTATLSAAPSSAYSAVGINGVGYTSSANANANTTVNGVAGYGQYGGTGTLGSAYGLSFAAQNLSTGTITNAVGMYGYAKNSSTGTITNATGISAYIGNGSTGLIGSGYGLYVRSPANSGTISNTYGVFIQSQAAGTQTNAPYGLYQAGSTDRNYFAGSVGIGTASPANVLDVYGSVAIGTPYAGVTAAPTNGMIVSGSVGIGTASLLAPLEVISSISNNAFFTNTAALSPTSGAGMAGYTSSLPTAAGQRLGYLVFGSRGNGNGAAIAGFSDGPWTVGASLPSYLTFETANTTSGRYERMRITSTGLIGIGTTTPQNRLDVYGAIAIGSGYAGINTAPTNGMIVVGSVGIGSTSPVVSLDLSQRTDALALPVGASSQRPTGTALANGEIRYNTSGVVEYWNGSTWVSLEASGSSSGLYLGASVTTPNPAASATDLQTGLYTAGPGKVDFTSAGTQTVEISTAGVNIIDGSLKIAGQNGVSFPLDYTTDASIAIGSGALAYQTLGTATPGIQANIAIGYQALGSTGLTATATNNTAMGYLALAANTSGNTNTAVGSVTLQQNTSGVSNTAIGRYAIRTNTTGSYNTAVGHSALAGASLTTLTGSGNTAMGDSSLVNIQGAAVGNTAFGLNSGVALTSGSYNLILGYTAASTTLATGSYNILIGIGSEGTAGGVDTPATNTSHYLNIGNTLEGNTQYATAIGSETLYLNSVSGSVNYVQLSGGATGTGPTLATAGTDTNVNLIISPKGTGNVGIGTTAPGSLLHIYSASATGLKVERSTAANSNIQFTNTNGSMYAGLASTYFGIGPNADLTSAPFIVTSASVGVGTAVPSSPLHIYSTSSSGLKIERSSAFNSNIQFTNTVGSMFAGLAPAGTYFGIGSTGDLTSAPLIVTSAGNVGIGSTAPVVSLDFTGRTDAIALPSGTSSTRPTGTALANGEIRYNTSGVVEFWNGSTWVSLASGAGTGKANYTARWTTATALGTGTLYDNGTQVSIGNAAPVANAALDVTGTIYSRTVNASSSTTINWASGNEQYTTASCGSFSFSGMVDGGSYTLLVEGTTSGTCVFTNSDSPTLTFRLPSNHGATTSGTMTLYHFTRLGTYVIATWMPGYAP